MAHLIHRRRSLLRTPSGLLGALALALACNSLTGVNDLEVVGDCVPGEQQGCACSGGLSGVQTCLSRDVYTECNCNLPAGGAGGTGSGTGGRSGSAGRGGAGGSAGTGGGLVGGNGGSAGASGSGGAASGGTASAGAAGSGAGSGGASGGGGASASTEPCTPGAPYWCARPGAAEPGLLTCQADGLRISACSASPGIKDAACSLLEQQLRSCGALSDGFFNCAGGGAAAACVNNCLAPASCADRLAALCGGTPLASVSACLATCGEVEDTEVLCDDGGMILSSWLCDGEADCTDGSDEEGCTAPIGFYCADGARVPILWVCDGELDCADGTDELAQCAQPTCQ